MFAGNFPPRGWAYCDGQLLAVSQNDALFSLFGTIYGGDGRTTFGLPDLRGRIPVHQGTGPGLSAIRLGEKSGTETVTLNSNQIPSHTHTPRAETTPGNATTPVGGIFANPGGTVLTYKTAASPTNMNPAAITNAGGTQSHSNLMPTLCVRFIVSLFGVYPSRQ